MLRAHTPETSGSESLTSRRRTERVRESTALSLTTGRSQGTSRGLRCRRPWAAPPPRPACVVPAPSQGIVVAASRDTWF